MSTIPITAAMCSVTFEPKEKTNFDKTISPVIAPIMPSEVAIPAIKAKRDGGNHIEASLSTPTKANAEPNPTKNRPN